MHLMNTRVFAPKIQLMMKKLIFLGLILAFITSCSTNSDDNSPRISYVILPIETVIIPSSFGLDQTYQIRAIYYRPSNCYTFNEFYFETVGNERIVAIVNSVVDNVNCETVNNDLIEVSFNFVATDTGTYIFKFWHGFDLDGNDEYLTYEIPVLN